MNILRTESFCSQRTTERCSSVDTPQARLPFLQLKAASEHAHARLLPRLSRSWTVLLPFDTHRPVTSITAVLLPFVSCLLTRSCSARVESCILF
jgi:hypothetical protein